MQKRGVGRQQKLRINSLTLEEQEQSTSTFSINFHVWEWRYVLRLRGGPGLCLHCVCSQEDWALFLKIKKFIWKADRHMSLLTQCLKACSSLSWVRPKVAAGNSIHISYTDGRDPNICYITCRMLNSTMLEAEEMQHEPRDSDICISSDGFNALSNVQPWRKICHKVKQVLRAAVNSGSIFNVSLPSVFCDRGFSPNRECLGSC